MTKHTLTAGVVAVLLAGCLVAEAAASRTSPKALSDVSVYAPDLVSAAWADAMDASAPAAPALPQVLPFWADMVNKELVPSNGRHVYVAVLDTGLLAAAPFLFEHANIAWDLGKGFSHEITWNGAIGDLEVGPLLDNRGYLTNLASGHGTHVTSTIAGFRYKSATADYIVKGIAPGVTIIPVLVLDAWVVDTPYGKVPLSGGTDEMVAAGIRYVAGLAATLDGPVVINMSLGGPDRSPEIEAAVDEAIASGVIVVASAGNLGAEGLGYPGGLPQVISAAAGGWATMFGYGWRADVPENLKTRDALDNHWQIYLEDFSSRPNRALGQKNQDIDVTAPGAWIVGPYKAAFSGGTGYYYLSGTSMAAPHVASIAALVAEAKPSLGQAAMENVLRSGARGLPLPACDAVVCFPFEEPYYYTAEWSGGDWGAGFLRADAAIAEAAKSKK
jgi:subtilisin family serine protease